MAVIEKKIVTEVLVCDSCEEVIEGDTATKLIGSATGYMKRDHFEMDLCEGCAAKVGLKRRGRKPAEMDDSTVAPVKRGPGRPRKNPLADPNAPKRGPGRPRKDSYLTATSAPSLPMATMAYNDDDPDPEPDVVETIEEW